MRIAPKDMPARTDGEAHLFNDGTTPYCLTVISTTGCIAVRDAAGQVRVHYWYYRAKKKEPIVIECTPWIILWSCRAPWNTEPAGHITRLHCGDCALTSLNVRSLTNLVHLRCEHNTLYRLDCSGMQRLKSLDCSGNELTNLDVDGCRALERLRVAGNPRLPWNATQLLARARGEPKVIRKQQLTATSLFDL
jgi:Leucine-rich repeat (LRR) protein